MTTATHNDTEVTLTAGDLPAIETTLGGIKEVARRSRRQAANFAPDPQLGFEEKTLEDPDLEVLLDERLLTAEAARRYSAANLKIKKIIEDRGLEDGVRYRCGDYVFRLESKPREGYDVDAGVTRRFAELTADN